jgi:hypothetical protein
MRFIPKLWVQRCFRYLREPQEKMIHIKPKNVAAGIARRHVFGFYYFL